MLSIERSFYGVRRLETLDSPTVVFYVQLWCYITQLTTADTNKNVLRNLKLPIQ